MKNYSDVNQNKRKTSDGGLNHDERTILRVANLLDIYDYCEKRDKKRFRIRKRLRKSDGDESFTSTVT